MQNERWFEILDGSAVVQNVTIMAECETVDDDDDEEEEEEATVNERSNIISHSEAESVLTKCS
jgi:hypothetical protein